MRPDVLPSFGLYVLNYVWMLPSGFINLKPDASSVYVPKKTLYVSTRTRHEMWNDSCWKRRINHYPPSPVHLHSGNAFLKHQEIWCWKLWNVWKTTDLSLERPQNLPSTTNCAQPPYCENKSLKGILETLDEDRVLDGFNLLTCITDAVWARTWNISELQILSKYRGYQMS